MITSCGGAGAGLPVWRVISRGTEASSLAKTPPRTDSSASSRIVQFAERTSRFDDMLYTNENQIAVTSFMWINAFEKWQQRRIIQTPVKIAHLRSICLVLRSHYICIVC